MFVILCELAHLYWFMEQIFIFIFIFNRNIYIFTCNNFFRGEFCGTVNYFLIISLLVLLNVDMMTCNGKCFSSLWLSTYQRKEVEPVF